VDVPDALALVRLRLADLPDVGSHLTDELLVEAAHHGACRRGHLHSDAPRGLERHRVRVPDLELDLGRALRGRAVADTDDLELALVALGDAVHHVRHERERQTVQGTVLTLVVRPRDDDLVTVARDRDRRWRGVLEGALGPLDRHRATLDGHVDTRRDGDRLLADSGHDAFAPTRR